MSEAAPCRVRIVVPVLNEAPAIGSAADAWRALRREGAEIVVVDGGSHDGGAALAEAASDRVLQSAPGRAVQMNAGADTDVDGAHPPGVLLFLHVDTRLPSDALDAVRAAVGRGASWGRFDVRLDSSRPLLRLVASLMNGRSRLTGIATGDQAMFVSIEAWRAVGGFPLQPLMEDIELSKRLKRIGPPACLRERVTTSARRWERHGAWRTILLMWRLRAAYFFGASPAVLAQRYAAPVRSPIR